MSFDYKILLGAVASLLIVVSYIPYLKSILSGRTLPHAFSWFVWALVSGIGFFAQLASGAGSGAWETGVSALGCFLIFLFALKRRDRQYSFFDWAALVSALLALLLWQITNQPVLAAIFVTLGDALGFLPTYRKGLRRPYEEHLAPFAFGTSASGVAFFAIQSYTPAAWLYPVSLVITNGLFVVLVLIKRRALRFRATQTDH